VIAKQRVNFFLKFIKNRIHFFEEENCFVFRHSKTTQDGRSFFFRAALNSLTSRLEIVEQVCIDNSFYS